MTLTCVASGGKPLPKITWWRDGELIAEGTQYFPDRKKSVGILKIAKLKRSHLLAVYSCEVSNSRVQPPLIVRIAVDMYLRPLEVTLVGENKDLSAGRRHNITCRSKGSRPPAIITWWKVRALYNICILIIIIIRKIGLFQHQVCSHKVLSQKCLFKYL